ncbi:MAG TPA: hypothetical protein H9987_03655 [Candidatus Luteococcus avicola]|nr:hypothetical protein [Candidatus Luteococcus avicola]
MASPNPKLAKNIQTIAARQAASWASDPEVRRSVVAAAKPAADTARKALRHAAGRVPRRPDPFEALEGSLREMEAMIVQRPQGAVPSDLLAQWRARLAGLRSGAALAKADAGKGRKQKLKDLTARQHALLDEIYAALVDPTTAGKPTE